MTSIWILLPPLTRGQYFMNICIGCKLWGAPSVGFLAEPLWAYLHFNYKCINNQPTATEISDHSSTCSLSKKHLPEGWNVCHWGKKNNFFFSFVWANNHESGFTFKPAWCGGGENAFQRSLKYWLWITLKVVSQPLLTSHSLLLHQRAFGREPKQWCWQTSCRTYRILPKNKKTKRLTGTWCGQMSWVCCCWHFIKAMRVCVIILMLKNLFDRYYNWEFRGKTFHAPMLLHRCKQTSRWVKEVQQVGVKNRLRPQPGKFIPGCCYHCIIVFVNHILGSNFLILMYVPQGIPPHTNTYTYTHTHPHTWKAAPLLYCLVTEILDTVTHRLQVDLDFHC